MGGHQAGEVASALSVATIENFVLHILKRFSNLQVGDEQAVVKDLQTALQQADARIFEEASHHPEFMGMGTTLTMAFISGWKLFVMHAGDSRCYLLRGGKLRQLTSDHTVAAELARSRVPAGTGPHASLLLWARRQSLPLPCSLRPTNPRIPSSGQTGTSAN
jgi:protein phosphatase